MVRPEGLIQSTRVCNKTQIDMPALRKTGSKHPAPRFPHPPQSSDCESVESFLARGGKITFLQHGEKGAQSTLSARDRLRQSLHGAKRS